MEKIETDCEWLTCEIQACATLDAAPKHCSREDSSDMVVDMLSPYCCTERSIRQTDLFI